jgi:arylesterase/paraoxonase
MKRVLKVTGGVVAAVLLVLIGISANFLARGGAFKTLQPHFAGRCESLPTGGPSGEDIQIDRERGVAYISAFDRRALIRGEDVRGTVWQLDLNAATPEFRPAITGEPEDFRPHGLSLHVDPEGQRTLLVISHPPAGHHTVERFESTEDGMFAHRETFVSELLFDPNDLVALGPRQFYLVNDSGAEMPWQRATEMLFARGLATLVYFDGTQFRVALEGLAGPSGVNVIAAKRRLAVAETLGQRLRIYDYTDPLALRAVTDIELGSSVDNIDTAADGSLWLAAHADTLALIRHFTDAASPAPTQLFRIHLDAADPRVEEIYLNDGHDLSAGSVGATYQDQLLIGSITEPKLLRCRITDT